MMVAILDIIKKIMSLVGTIITIVLAFLSTMIYFAIKWMFETWNNLTVDELFFHLYAPLDGTNEGMISEFLNICMVPAVLVVLFLLLLFAAFRSTRKYYILMVLGIIMSLSFSGISVYGAWGKLDIGNYVENQGEYSTFIDDYYVNPGDVEIAFPEQKRNLIYVFLESMEITYADIESGGAFDVNVIPELTKLAQENEDFSGESKELNGGVAMSGTTWTMGAMFAHTSGLPLKISIDGNSMDTQENFFENVISLGDILEKEGYSQTLMIGSDATFGGRRLYFMEHGNYDFIDYRYAIDTGMIPPDYGVWWGYEDEKLFAFAKEKLIELSSQDNPFNLTLLTVDTHFEDGYLCDKCLNTYEDDQYSNVMACSSCQVYEFVEWVKKQDFYDNTTIVLVGDHPTMDSDFCANVADDYVRKVYTAYINSAIEPEVVTARSYTTFDNFPTTLAALGVSVEGERLGLGTNLFSSTQTLTERYDIKTVAKEIGKKSRLMEELSEIDEDKEALWIREGKAPTATVSIDEYQADLGILPISLTDIDYIPGNIVSVMAAVWVNEDQSDLKWLEMEADEENNYFLNIDLGEFNYKTGDYHVDVYVKNSDGEEYGFGGMVRSIE